MENLNPLLPYFENKKIILIGENHGVVENTTFVSSLTSLLSEKNIDLDFVGFEYPVTQYDTFMKYLDNDDFEELTKTKWGEILSNDGRFSKAHFDLLKKFRNENMKIVFFDTEDNEWDQRDKAMYENLKQRLQNTSNKVLLVTGNIHSKFNKINLNGKDYVPFASYLDKSDVCDIELKYHGGEFFNHSRREFESTDMPDRSIEQIDETTVNFHIAKATPTQ